MATLTRTVPLTLSVEKDTLILSGDGIEVRHETGTADLDALADLYVRRVKRAVKEARDGSTGFVTVTLDQVRTLVEKLSRHADHIGSAQIEIRDEARQRENRMTPGLPQ